MHYIKAQQDIFKTLVNGNRVCRFDVDEQHTFITNDGFKGWIFPNEILMVNVEKIPTFKPLEITSIIRPENKLEITLDFKLPTASSKDLLRKLKSCTKHVFLRESFLKYFQNACYYQELDKPLGHVVVTEIVRGVDHPVGIILPVRTNYEDV